MDFLKKALIGVLMAGFVAGASAQDNTKAVAVHINVTNDRTGIIEAAFAKALFEQGIEISKNDAPYTLEVNITIEPLDINIGSTKFVRITLDSQLSNNNTVILPYFFNTREGYFNQDGAEQRSYNTAAKKIAAEYGALLEKVKAEGKL